MYFNYDTSKKAVILRKGDKVKEINAFDLRVGCSCALCIDELSGKLLLNHQNIDKEVYPTGLVRKGNYAIAITWSDGHKSSIYPFETLFEKDFTS